MNSGKNLKTTLGSLNLVNPFLLASGPPTASTEMIRRGFQAGWAGAVIKTIRPDGMSISDLSPRFAAWNDSDRKLLGFENYELLSKHTISYWKSGIQLIKKEYPDRILIASIMGDTNPDSWKDLAITVQDAGADALELNMSCPHGMPELGVGLAIGQNPLMVKKLTSTVVKSADLPVFVKLTPNITDIALAAQAAREGGATGVSAINTVQCIMGVDIETGFPRPSVCGYSTPGGYSGPAVKPIGLKMVARIAESIPLAIMGIGGISTFEDAVEYMLLGASAVQVCTAVMWNGYGIIRDMNKGLAEYLARKGYTSPDELTGLSLSRFVSHQALDRSKRIYPHVAGDDQCQRCGACVISCRDGGYQALSMTNKGPVVDLTRCDGCGLCLLRCPSGALIPFQR